MTAKLFNFIPKDDPQKMDGQTAVGQAFCIGCDHNWVAVAPVGTTQLECPECRTRKGKWVFEFAPEPGTEVYTCNCGNQLYYMTRLGHMCAGCGVYISYDNHM